MRAAFAWRGRLWRARKRAARAVWRRRHALRAGTYAQTLARVRTRDQIPELLNRRGLTGTGVEIGVKRGGYSEFLLRHWRGRLLISVDPWLEDDAGAYVDRANVGQAIHDRYYAETAQRLARFGPRSEIRRQTSLAATAGVADESLDFVYIDARHDRASVEEDLRAWYPKVRGGGVVAGHDYVDGSFANGEFGVKSAVDAFFGDLGVPVHATDGGPRAVEVYPSWIVVKPAS